jgi:hypothetical protein
VAIVADQQNGSGGDLVINAWAAFGRRGLIALKTSGNYDSLLGLSTRHHHVPIDPAAKVPSGPIERISVMGVG